MSVTTEILVPAFEKRIITSEENGQKIEREFQIQVIKSSEDFKPAAEYQQIYSVKFLGQKRVMRLPVRGISFGEWEQVDDEFKMPESPENPNDKEKEEHDKEREGVLKLRQIKIFEMATGKSIPGESNELKAEWIGDNIGVGELQGLYHFILENGSNVAPGSLLPMYEQAEEASEKIVSDFNNFDEWALLSNSGTVFRMQRPFENFLVEIPLKQVTERMKKAIDEQSKCPPPPSRARIDKNTGKQIGTITDWNNPNYKQQAKLSNRRSIVHLFDACLNFVIPGDSIDSKYKWIASLLLGDVVKLRNFIEQEVFSYRNKIDFF